MEKLAVLQFQIHHSSSAPKELTYIVLVPVLRTFSSALSLSGYITFRWGST